MANQARDKVLLDRLAKKQELEQIVIIWYFVLASYFWQNYVLPFTSNDDVDPTNHNCMK